jgi:Zn-dependent protease/CBS domain-containing protein
LFGKSFEIFRIFGIPIRLDPSWVPVVALVTWSLASSVFPVLAPGLAPSLYWWMGALATLGLFASVILHELAHSLVARRYGIPIRGITLFFFGGVAEMAGEPPSPRSELLVAAAGPAASLAVGGAGWGLAVGAMALEAPTPLSAVLGYLALTNAVLALFNLVPSFPLDGGRILRSLLWHWKNDLRGATRISSSIGAGFGYLMIGLGLLRALWASDWIGGVWWVLLGLFIRSAAAGAWEQLRLRQVLENEPVARLMHPHPVALPRSLSLTDWTRDYVYRYPFKMFPVLDDAGRLAGCIRVRRLQEIPREEWDRQTVGAFLEQCGPENTLPVDADALRALSLMSSSGASRLMVVEGDRLLGVLSLKDLLRFFTFRTEIEGI